MHMENPAWCRDMAQRCLQMAAAASTYEAHAALLDAATTWLRLADQPAGYGDVFTSGVEFPPSSTLSFKASRAAGATHA